MKMKEYYTTAREIQFLRSAPVLIAERLLGKKATEITPMELARVEERELADWYRKYLDAARLRVKWPALDRDAILDEAKKLYNEAR